MSEKRNKFPWETIYIRKISTPETRPVVVNRYKAILWQVFLVSLIVFMVIKTQKIIELLSNIHACL